MRRRRRVLFLDDPEDAKQQKILRKVWELQADVFGSDEIDSFEDMRAEFIGTHPRVRLYCTVATTSTTESGADDDSKEIVEGASIWEYFLESRCFIYSYLLIRPGGRHKGAGREIADVMWKSIRGLERTGGLENRGIFVEMHDPDVDYQEADSMDPVRRVRMFTKMGVRQIGRPKFQFWQPPLETDEHVPFLLGLVVTRRTERDASNRPALRLDVLADFLRAYYRDCAGENFENDAYYQRMIRDLEERRRRAQRKGSDQNDDDDETSYLSLVPFDCLRRRDEHILRSVSSTSKRRPLVVVVGAGLAGLTCATELVEDDGVDVVVVEANSVAGGRVRTIPMRPYRCVDEEKGGEEDEAAPRDVDVGASWVHGTKGNPLLLSKDRAARPKLRRTRWGSSAILFRPNGERLSPSRIDALGPVFDALVDRCARVAALRIDGRELPRADMSLSQALEAEILRHEDRREWTDADRDALSLFVSGIESEEATRFDRLSACFYGLSGETYEGGDHMLVDGATASLIDPAIRRLRERGARICTNTRVAVVARRQDPDGDVGVDVTIADDAGRHQTLRADAAVMTMSIGVLRYDGAVEFRPRLDASKRHAIDRCGFGTMEKVAIRWRRRDVFWDRHVEVFGYNGPLRRSASGTFAKRWSRLEGDDDGGDNEEQNGSRRRRRTFLDRKRHNMWILNMLPVNGEPTLVTLATGALSEEMQTMTEAQRVDRVLAALAIMFPDASRRGESLALPVPTHIASSSWGRDPTTRGSYSHVSVGSQSSRSEIADALARPVWNGRLRFAGEATSRARFGYMDGATESGKREARALRRVFAAGSAVRSRL